MCRPEQRRLSSRKIQWQTLSSVVGQAVHFGCFELPCRCCCCQQKMKYTCTIDCQQHSTATTMRQIHQSAVGDCTSLHSDAAADNACCLQDKNLLAVRLPTLACMYVDITQLFQHVRLAVEVFCRHTGARKLVPVILLGCRRKVPAK